MHTRHLFALALLALAACGGDAAEDTGKNAGDGAAGEEAVLADTGAKVPAAASPGGDTAQAALGSAVTLNTANNSGATGIAQLMDHAGQTMVTVTLNGASPGAHAGHVHEGTCDAPGRPVAPLQDATVPSANASATAVSTIALPLATVMNGRHIIAYHQGSGANTGAPIVCAPVPGQVPPA
ncbi:MAG TPA: hypothetical protein VFQ45_00380 [Longimicrobium sp.]|nr:hypothetical protein [Longimicrobium sp.]